MKNIQNDVASMGWNQGIIEGKKCSDEVWNSNE